MTIVEFTWLELGQAEQSGVMVGTLLRMAVRHGQKYVFRGLRMNQDYFVPGSRKGRADVVRDAAELGQR